LSLADDILALRDRVLAELSAAHDYYANTKTAWDLVISFVAAGNQVSVRNTVTGTVTTQADLAAKARGYVAEQLTEATFQQFISIFEGFVFDLLRLWLLAYPRNLIGKQLEFKDVVDAPDKDAVVLHVVNSKIHEVSYKRVTEWFEYLAGLVKLGCPTADDIGRIAEAKACRDLLVHNRGVANKTYKDKAGKFARARYTEGMRVDITEQDHHEAWQLIQKLVADICNAACGKASAP
jgi:hypothetical protein